MISVTCVLFALAGGHLVARHHGDRARERRAAALGPASDESALPHPTQPAAAAHRRRVLRDLQGLHRRVPQEGPGERAPLVSSVRRLEYICNLCTSTRLDSTRRHVYSTSCSYSYDSCYSSAQLSSTTSSTCTRIRRVLRLRVDRVNTLGSARLSRHSL